MKSVVIFALLVCSVAVRADSPATVAFDWFDYRGHNAIYSATLSEGSFQNPILPGYYPDPSVVPVGDKHYLVNSTFAHFPGIPIHEPRSGALETHRACALRSRQSELRRTRSLEGRIAPSIHFYDDTFYIVNTVVDAGSILSTEVAGGSVGTVLGPFARQEKP